MYIILYYYTHHIICDNYSLVLITYVRALAQVFDKHKKIAKINFSNWCMLLLLVLSSMISLIMSDRIMENKKTGKRL
jgi:uncharacterized membrane protein YozB (DUF420 family)